jgi:small GTP-binding protein
VSKQNKSDGEAAHGGYRAGFSVLVGRPNSGKSTLANVLAEREQAIVSDLPGTTRDWTEHPAAIEGVPFTIVDTAGIRSTDDPIEAEAVRRAREQVYRARVIIRVIDLSGPPDTNEEALLPPSAGSAGDHAPILDVYNKADLPAHAGHVGGGPKAEDLRVSARTGDGIDHLRAALLAAVGMSEVNLGEPDGPQRGVPRPGDGPARQDGPRQMLVAPFTAEQTATLEQVRDILTSPRADRAAAVGRLRKLLSPAG